MMQGTAEWHTARLGRATASRFSDVLAKVKTGEAAGRRNYRAQLVCERMTGVPTESYTSAAMQWGVDTEGLAREAYEAQTGNLVQQVAFIPHPEIMSGGSPDGCIDLDGMIEIKCPLTASHIDTILKGMPPEHMAQIQGLLWLSHRQWVDFVSFDPRMPEKLQLYIQRVPRDEEFIRRLESEVRAFLIEVDRLIEQLERKMTD